MSDSNKNVVLVVDDEKPIRDVLAAALEDEGYAVITAENGEEGLKQIERHSPPVTLLDVWMPGKIDGIGVLKASRDKFPMTDFIVMSGHGTIETAVQATKLGAWDFVEKPISLDKITILIKNILSFQKEKEEKRNLLHKLRENIAIVGSSDHAKVIKQLIVKVAPSAHWVLVEGEVGVGKELVANNIHYLSPRAGYTFVDFKSLQVPEDLVEGELFGYEEGALPGGSDERRGKFDLAHDGTLFIDDIDALPSSAQEKIYRYLQTGKIQRQGGTKFLELNVRVIAATTVNLAEKVKSGQFHPDLYARLNLLPFKILPLRERREDVEALIHYFNNRAAASGGFSLKTFSERAMELLIAYEWPGNVRELKNFIERVYILTPEDVVDVHDVKFAGLKAGATTNYAEFGSFREARAQFEKEYILSKINEYNGNISKTAESIGLERSYLHRKIKSFGIDIEGQ
ncbi:MAG: sigma-54-dependent Fis family transcriptional regulator [Bdellovibrionaceae bacterium]|nr:sigma-54-dependent Fis family transcriptional regulator [Pseudobdellovibrionaceae bacterium]